MTATTEPQLLTVDPATLKAADQVRADATPDDQLVESVARFGIQQPPTVVWDAAQNAYVIAMGHRRVGAAIAAGLPTIHVIVRDPADITDAIKLEQQIVENERRKSLTPGELARGWADLEAIFGQTPEDIATALAEPVERVRAGIKTARSAKTAALIEDEPAVDLEQAAIIADFEDRDDIQARLLQLAVTRPSEFPAAVSRERAQIENEARVAKLRAEAAAEGVTVVGERGYDDLYWRGSSDTGWAGARLQEYGIRPEEHTECPGHAVIINAYQIADQARLDYVCTDTPTNGHTRPTATAEQRELTPEEIAEQERRDQERAAAEEKRQELVANSTARREWLRGFLKGRLNQTAGIFDLIAEATLGLIILDDYEPWAHYSIAEELITGEPVERPAGRYYGSENRDRFTELVISGQVAPLRALVAHALAVCEEAVGASDLETSAAPRLVQAYYEHLGVWGYALTDLDRELFAAAVSDGLQDAGDDTADVDEEDEGDE